jgi:hypothetical protein
MPNRFVFPQKMTQQSYSFLQKTISMTSIPADDAVVAYSDLFEGLHVGDENLIAVCGSDDDDDDDDAENKSYYVKWARSVGRRCLSF